MVVPDKPGCQPHADEPTDPVHLKMMEEYFLARGKHWLSSELLLAVRRTVRTAVRMVGVRLVF